MIKLLIELDLLKENAETEISFILSKMMEKHLQTSKHNIQEAKSGVINYKSRIK